jgi:hypothetical protein
MPIDPRFDWHPEPELIAITDEPASRPALERLGAEAWGAALDYLYDEALRRAMGEPASYDALRRRFFGEPGGPTPAPSEPTPSAELLAEFTAGLRRISSTHGTPVPSATSLPRLYGCPSSASSSPR